MSRILIVEDETFIGNLLQSILTDAGHTVTCIEDGLEAWETLQADPAFDLVLLDRQLPGMDGMDLLRRLKQDGEALADIPVVMQTGLGDEESIREGLDAGAYYYLTKPVQAKSLLAVIDAALEYARDNRAMRTALHEANRLVGFLDSGRFSCRTLDEARLLAQGLAKTFPEPEKVVMGLTELLLNAVEHGNLALSYDDKTRLMLDGNWYPEVARRLDDPRYADRRASVEFERDAGEIRVCITDEGEGFDWQEYLDFSPDRAFDPHGRGIALARKLSFDTLRYEGRGNRVVVTVKTAP